MARQIVRTVLGDIDPLDLGTFNYHEHLFQQSPLLQGDTLDDEAKSALEAQSLTDAGTKSMIEATPTGLGRNPSAVARISLRTGLAIVHTTGAHHGGHYPDHDPIRLLSVDDLTSLFTADVLDGFAETRSCDADRVVRAGIIKAGIRYWSIGSFERKVLTAVAATHRATDASVMVHLDFGSATHEVLDILAFEGVAANRVVLAHVDRNLDPGLHTSLTERGAYLGYDGFARHREAPDSAILACLQEVIAAGGQEQVLLGGDVARATRYRAYGGIPGLDYLARQFLPRLKNATSEEAYLDTTQLNGARFLKFSPPR